MRSTVAPGNPAKNLIPPIMWSYNDSIVDYPHDPAAAKKLLADGRPTRTGSRPICGPCRCSAPTTPMRAASPN